MEIGDISASLVIKHLIFFLEYVLQRTVGNRILEEIEFTFLSPTLEKKILIVMSHIEEKSWVEENRDDVLQ